MNTKTKAAYAAIGSAGMLVLASIGGGIAAASVAPTPPNHSAAPVAGQAPAPAAQAPAAVANGAGQTVHFAHLTACISGLGC
jgi:hypothetical protein